MASCHRQLRLLPYWVLMVASVLLVGAGDAAAAQAPPELTTSRQAHALTLEEAAKYPVVHLHGVVTVPSAFGTSFFLSDTTGGIFIRSAIQSPKVKQGDYVDLQGIATPGQFAPEVLAQRLQVTGKGKLPPARVYPWQALTRGRQDSNWIAVRGVVHSADVEPLQGRPVLAMQVDMGENNMVTVLVTDYSAGGWEGFRGAKVRIVGASGSSFNTRRQFIGLRLYVAQVSDIVVEKSAGDPFNLPLRSIDRLLQFGDSGQTVRRPECGGS